MHAWFYTYITVPRFFLFTSTVGIGLLGYALGYIAGHGRANR